MSIDFSYNRTLYSPQLKDWAELMVRLLPPSVSILVSSSSSSCAIPATFGGLIPARTGSPHLLTTLFALVIPSKGLSTKSAIQST